MQTMLKMQGPEGLLYIPINGRPWALPAAANPWAIDPLPNGDHWCSICPTGRALGAFCIHFHAHTAQIMAALEAVQVTGESDLLALAQRAYDYAVGLGESLVGFFPEWLDYKGGAYGEGQVSSEICEVADMIASALKLSLLGIDKWDDVDRWVRNQFAECQLIDTGWLTDGHLERVDRTLAPLPGAGCSGPEHGTTERVIERAVGSFSGWPSVNDFVQGKGWSVMHCCTGNATRAVYYVWEKILTHEDGKLKINLLLNRASLWADVHSHIPYRGQVDVHVKQNLDLEVRLAEWAKLEEARCTVGGKPRELTFDGRYARVGAVKTGETVTLTFPILLVLVIGRVVYKEQLSLTAWNACVLGACAVAALAYGG